MSLISKAASFLFGGGDGVKTIANTVDELHYSGEERAADDGKDLASARAFAAPGAPPAAPSQPGLLYHFAAAVNVLVDAVNRAIRPWITIELCLRWFGYKEFPNIQGIDPIWVTGTWVVLTFWFGGRTLVKDIPSMVKALRGK